MAYLNGLLEATMSLDIECERDYLKVCSACKRKEFTGMLILAWKSAFVCIGVECYWPRCCTLARTDQTHTELHD